MSGIAAVVLAAGRSSRYRAAGGAASTKLVAEFEGEPLVRQAVRAALGSSAHPVVVVTGHAREDVEAALVGLDVAFAHNPHFADGLATSLGRGLAAVPDDCDGALILLGDMPRVGAGTIDALVAAAGASPGLHAVVPTSGGVRGNPVVLMRPLFAAAARLTGDEGARSLLRAPDLVVLELPLDNAGTRLDLDEPQDFLKR